MEQIKEYEYVDLGLPSGLKWAKCNVGAETETDYGYYFQWGDIEDKSNANCIWESYKYCNGSYDTLTKYNNNSLFGTVDNKKTLEPEDDAARVYMGGDWRMPTMADFQELINKRYTFKEWIEDYNGTGVSGRKITSKTNGNSIFIPAAGICRDGSVDYVGSSGVIWSSSLGVAGPSTAWYLCFDSSIIFVYCSSGGRCYGFTVRGIME